MDITVLGSVNATEDHCDIALGGPRQRRLLAVLVIGEGRVVSNDRIIDAVWGDEIPPDGAAKTLLSYVSRLRSALGDGWVVTGDDGYALAKTRDSVDAKRFEELLDRSRAAQPHDALPLLDQALGLWHGRAFGDLADEDWCRPVATRLEELRLVALEARCQARLDTGAHVEVVADLEGLVSEHPLRERFRAQQMLALYRSGRQAEALRAFNEHRRFLADETGLEPSRDLLALERRIAVADPSLAFVTAGRTTRGYVLADEIGEGAFGTVYRALQPSVGREVAVKVVKAELADDPAYIRRFEGEARVVARLEHPHIVPLYDFWREPGAAYLVFRYIRGGNVESARLGSGRWPLERVDRLVNEIGAALAVAHAANIVHRDVKPANLLYDETGNSYLADFGIALEGVNSESVGGALRSAGSPLYASPEQVRDGTASPRSDQYALAVVAWELLAGVAPFEGTLVTELLQNKLTRGLPPLGDRRPDLADDISAVLSRAAALHPEDRFSSMAEFLTLWRDAVTRPARAAVTTGRLDSGANTPAQLDDLSRSTLASIGVASANPYKGLRAFDEGDTAQFHGRSGETDALVELVGRHRVVAVVGPSGSGKSSLVRAGLIPRLRDLGRIVTVAVPGSQPVDELSESLVRIAVEAPPHLREGLLDAEALPLLIDELLPDDGTELVVVLDQFEELWTLAEPSQRNLVLAALTAAATSPDSRLRVVVAIRADFYDRPLAHPLLGPLVRDASFAVTPLGPAELEMAITAPAASVGVRVEPALLASLVADVVTQPAGLPLLQYTLTELYDRREGTVLTKATYDEMGGLAGALSRRAEEVLENLGAEQQTAVRRLFSRLVSPGAGSEDTRRRARRSELSSIPGEVVDAFGAARLLTFDVDPTDREPTVEVAHEALIRHWPRLRDWLSEDRDGLRVHRHLADAAAGWRSRGREQGELYRGSRLATAADWVADHPGELSSTETHFLGESHRRARRTRRTRRIAVGSLAALTVAAVAGAGLAVRQGQRADRNAAAATASATAADLNSQRADTNAALAEDNASLAEQRANDAASSEAEAIRARDETALQKLASDAAGVARSQRELGLLLAVEAYRRNPGVESESALATTLTAQPGIRRFIDIGIPDVRLERNIASGGGLIAVTVERDDELPLAVLIDASTLRPTGVLIEMGGVSTVAVRPDGLEVATSSVQGGVRRWSPTTGDQLGPTIFTEPRVVGNGSWPIAYLPDGSLVVTSSDTLTIHPPDGTSVARTLALGGPVESIAVDPTGSMLAVAQELTGGVGRTIWLVDAGTLAHRDLIAGHPNFFVAVAFAGEGRVLAADFPAGAIARLFELRIDGTPSPSPAPLPALPNSVLPRADGSAIIGLVSGGYVVADPDLIVSSRHPSTATVFALLQDGQLLATSPGGLIVADPDDRSVVISEMRSGGEPLVGQIATNADGTVMVVAGPDGYQRYDIATMAPIGSAFQTSIPGLSGGGSLSPDGRLVAVSSFDRSEVVDTETGQPLWASVQGGGLAPPSFSPDGSSMVINGIDGIIRVVDVASGRLRWESDLAAGNVTFPSTWSPDGSRIGVATTASAQPFVLDAATGDVVRHQDIGRGIAFSPDGHTAAVFGADLRIIDFEGGPNRVLSGGGGLFGGGFADEGRIILGLALDGTLQVVDVTTGDRIGNELRFAPDLTGGFPSAAVAGTRMIVGFRDAVVVAIEFDPAVYLELACEAAGRNLTEDEWKRHLSDLGEYRATCPEFAAG